MLHFPQEFVTWGKCNKITGAIVLYILHLPLCFRYFTMVRHYIKKNTAEPKYSQENLKIALQEITAGRLTIYSALKKYGIPYSTLYTRKTGTRGKICKSKGRPTEVPLAAETDLANGLKVLEKWGFGLSRKEVLERVGLYVQQNNIETSFKNGVPGEDWFMGFKKRHGLSLKVPENVEYCRKKAVDPFLIYGYFELLKETLTDLNLLDKPERIWNLDESSFSVYPRKSKIVGGVGFPALRTTSTSGRDNTTVLVMCNAAGGKAPPLIVFKGVNIWDQWVASEEKIFEGTVYAATKNGWMDSEVFRNYFVNSVIPAVGNDRPVLIIYDGHGSHVDARLIQTAISEQITIMKLPPHSTHLLQPLDLSVFKSLKIKWDEKLIVWQRQHLGLKLPKRIFSEFFCQAWKEVKIEVITNGFRKAGIFPLDAEVVSREKFSPEAIKRWDLVQEEKRNVNALNSQNGTQDSSNIDKETFSGGQEAGSSNNHKESISRGVQEAGPSNIHKDSISRGVQEAGPSGISSCNDETIDNEEIIINEKPITFTELLLRTIKQKPSLEKCKRTKVGLGSEVLTSKEVLQRLQEKSDLKKKKPTKNKETVQAISSDEECESPEYMESDDDNCLEFLEEESDSEINSVVEINSWVLVQYASKKFVKHYVGQVMDKDKDEDVWHVKFLKWKKDLFIWPVIEDTDSIRYNDIIKILPKPTTTRRGYLKFNVKFEGFNLK